MAIPMPSHHSKSLDLPSFYPTASSIVETEHPHCTGGIGLTCKGTLKTLIFVSENANLPWNHHIKPSLAGNLICSGDLWNNFSLHVCGGLESSPVTGSDGHNHTCAACKCQRGLVWQRSYFLLVHMNPPRNSSSRQVHPCGNSQSLSTDFLYGLMQRRVSCP